MVAINHYSSHQIGMNYFIKQNHSNHSKSLLAEAHGLEALRNTLIKCNSKLKIPNVFQVNEQSLKLTNIVAMPPSPAMFKRFGHELAVLHEIKHSKCGFEKDNFIGLNPQINTISDNWGAFFFEYRLLYQVKLITDNQIRSKFFDDLTSIQTNLINWLNQSCSHFSLLHGDLWSGNVLFDSKHVWLIDPAVYYGDADADMAMTELFGGFPQEFYDAYYEVKACSEYYPLKKITYNLYHQLNHYNLFGSIYLSSCNQAMKTLKDQFA